MFHTIRRFFHSNIRVHKNFEWIEPCGNKTDIVVYNPRIKRKTSLILRNKNVATWYMCGPTIYDSAHIGHACTYVKFDVIHRILSEFFDLNVVLIMGMTDIDDKIIKRANVLNQSWQSLTTHYENEFFSDMDSLNVKRPFMTCKVTNYIPEIIMFIKNIVDKDGAYIGNDGSVYFNVSKCKTYGKLEVPSTAESHKDKRSSLDFALWKSVKPNEPYWESPWGQGRPGWHIECSAIASTVLGNNIDIHSGGIDLKFPHHENEEAQSCCYHDTDQWVNYWLHTGHLHLQGDVKMSKSLQNTISVPTFLKTYTANHFRMLCLLSYYRNNIIFTEDLIENAVTVLKKIEFFLTDCNDYVSGKNNNGNIDGAELLKCLEETKQQVCDSFANDFNTTLAINSILNLISVSNKMLQEKKTETVARNADIIAVVSNYVQSIISKLGFSESANAIQSNDTSALLDILVEFRNEVRNRALEKSAKDIELLKACDKVRKSLSNCGVDIRDKQKSSWILRH